MRPGALGRVAICVGLFLGGAANAQPTSTAKADKLFNEGREALDAGRYKEACEKFEQSLAESDALGTRLNLALCMEKRGKTYSAVTKFDDAATRADREQQADSAKVAREHAEALRPTIPHLTVQISGAVPGEHVVISRPGEPDIEVTGTEPIPLDPSDPTDATDRITIKATATGYEPYTSEPRPVAAKSKDTVVVPALARAMVAPHTGPVVGGGGHRSHRKLYAIITGSAGIALMGGSALWALSAQSSLQKFCDDNPIQAGTQTPCDSDGDGKVGGYQGRAQSKYKTLHVYATGMFVAGVVAVGAGVVLYLTAPSSSESTQTAVVPTITPDGGGFAVLGHF